MLSTRDPLQIERHREIERKRYCMQIEMKKMGLAIIISDKVDFKTRAVTRNKEGHYIMIKTQFNKNILLL